MDDRQSIIGFTEAQLGFLLVLVFIVLWFVTTPPAVARPQAPKVAMVPKDSAEMLIRQIARMQHELDSLRSPILPSCKSKGITNGPLLKVIALGRDSFRVEDKPVSAEASARETRVARAAADAAGCRHEVLFGVSPELSAVQSEQARRLLNQMRLRIVPVAQTNGR